MTRRVTVLVLVLVALSTGARAQDCPVPEGTTRGVATRSAEERLQFLGTLLAREDDAARRWTLAWGATYGLATAAQLAIVPLFPAEERPDWYWGALSTLVGVAFTVLDPLEVLGAGHPFAQRARAAPPEDRCALIAEGERLLQAGAAHETLGTQWYIHLANVVFNVGIGLVLGLGYGRWTSGAINAAVGAAIGEATIFTSPNLLASGWRQYRAGEPPPVAVMLVPTPGPGLALRVEF